jgi:deoxyribodipyrimidine photo-lyase
MQKIHIWWIRRDIRLHDNQALQAACQGADQLIPLFIIEPELMDGAGPRRRAFLLHALADLDQQLKPLVSRLIIRQGPAQSALQSLVDELGGAHIFAHEDFSPFARQRDQAVAQVVSLNLYPGVLYQHPKDILKEDGEPYVVYTPFKNKWYLHPLPTPADCLPVPDHLPPVPANLTSLDLPHVEPVKDFPATAAEAQRRLTAFTNGAIRRYQSQRDRLDLQGTSQISPYLRFGMISAREAFAQAHIAQLQAKTDAERGEIQTWLNELVWREFYTTILYHFPKVLEQPFREDYEHIPWRTAPADLAAWQNGQTGYPVVDACLRQLLTTGWMHNRGRMIVASFLTKDLLINWQDGEAWFMHNLVDGDPAANNGGWQWSAGTGTDAAPYFRIFNPVTQGYKFDPDGDFIARWVPELRQLPIPFRHEPWKLDPADAERFSFRLGTDYPQRIVDHAFARQRTLEAYKAAREGGRN